jgi:Outer membrane protein beta-barrel domain
MRNLIFLLLLFPFLLHAQIGIKAGVNFANVTNASSISNSNRSGFMAGIFLAPASKSILSYKTELIFSQQGYDYNSNSTTGSVNLDYIIMPHLICINITKLFQLQIGGQVAYLLNAKADSNKTASSNNPYGSLENYYNKFDYGAAAGFEIHPVMGMLIGARYNISFGDMYKNISNSTPGTTPPFIPNVNLKNNVFQIFAGWRFGKADKKKHK